jgi:hypothetical protein
MSEQLSMGTHPDIMALRARYETASETAAGQIVGGTTFLAGVYLAISPWVVGFDTKVAVLFTDLVVGVAAALLGMGLSAAFDRTHRLSWTVPVLGIWTIVAPWVIRTGDLRTTDMQWSNVVTGAVLTLAGLAAVVMTLGRNRTRFGRHS